MLPDRYYDGNEGIKRPPRVGDCGTIVFIPQNRVLGVLLSVQMKMALRFG